MIKDVEEAEKDANLYIRRHMLEKKLLIFQVYAFYFLFTKLYSKSFIEAGIILKIHFFFERFKIFHFITLLLFKRKIFTYKVIQNYNNKSYSRFTNYISYI